MAIGSNRFPPALLDNCAEDYNLANLHRYCGWPDNEHLFFEGKFSCCIVPVDNFWLGFAIARAIDMPHQVTAQSAVMSPTLRVVGGGSGRGYEYMTPAQLANTDNEMLGVKPRQFMVADVIDYDRKVWSGLPKDVLLVYPSMWGSDAEIRHVMANVLSVPHVENVVVIAKSSIILTDFFSEQILMVKSGLSSYDYRLSYEVGGGI